MGSIEHTPSSRWRARYRDRSCRSAAPPSEAVRTHDLRHTCASLLIQLGAHPKADPGAPGPQRHQRALDLYGHLPVPRRAPHRCPRRPLARRHVLTREFRDTIMERRIHPSARKHDVADDDIRHAIEFARIVREYEDDDRILYLGPDNAANMLEVITVHEDDDSELVIQAMLMQKKYLTLLRGLGDPDD